MESIPNFLSFLRAPLALLFFSENVAVRTVALVLAALSDGLDGYLARKMKWRSQLGAIIDPLMDRFFVISVILVFISENKLQWWQVATLLCRDASVLLFGLYLVVKGKLASWKFRAIWCGKATTSLQFLVILLLTLNWEVHETFYSVFIVLGVLALFELYLSKAKEYA